MSPNKFICCCCISYDSAMRLVALSLFWLILAGVYTAFMLYQNKILVSGDAYFIITLITFLNTIALLSLLRALCADSRTNRVVAQKIILISNIIQSIAISIKLVCLLF